MLIKNLLTVPSSDTDDHSLSGHRVKYSFLSLLGLDHFVRLWIDLFSRAYIDDACTLFGRLQHIPTEAGFRVDHHAFVRVPLGRGLPNVQLSSAPCAKGEFRTHACQDRRHPGAVTLHSSAPDVEQLGLIEVAVLQVHNVCRGIPLRVLPMCQPQVPKPFFRQVGRGNRTRLAVGALDPESAV